MANTGYQGTLTELAGLGEFNQLSFMIRQMLNKVHIATLVQIVAVAPGGTGPVGTVSVIPLLNMVDGAGNAIPHGAILDIPYFRLQGGTNAIILDPEVNDIGLAIFADQDISNVKSSLVASIPATGRRNDWADGMYFGGFLNGSPVQYIQFTTNGVNVVTPGDFNVQAGGNMNANITGTATITAPTVDVNASNSATITTPNASVTGNLAVGGNLTVTGTITA